MFFRSSSIAGTANCIGAFIDRYVSAITSRRASASCFSAGGPLTAIHATFICGKPAIFDRPLNVNVSASSFAANVSGDCAPSE